MTWTALAKAIAKALPYIGTAVGSGFIGSAIGGSSARSSDESSTVEDYIKGLLTSVGDENVKNRTFNEDQAELNRQFQHDEAALQRTWYEEMSNSAYRRATYDMQRAGINPILAYSQGGAAAATSGVPTGSAASYNVGGGDTLSSILMSVADLISAINGSGRKVNARAIGFKA